MADETQEAIISEVLDAEDARLRAIDARDWAALDALLGEDLCYVHSDAGKREDKAANMVTLKVSPRSYVRRNLVVRPYGDVAVMFGDIDITVDALPDKPERQLFSYATQVWVKRDGRWQMVAFQATMIADKN